MNGPQLKDGYTRIANELLEAVYSNNFNGTQLKIILAIWRYTYGFNRKEHELSLNFLADATGAHKQQLKKELDSLIEKKVIKVTKKASFNTPRSLTVNKYYNKWLTVSESTDTTVSESTDTTVSESTYQERQYKDNIKDKVVVEGVPSPETTNPDKVPSHCQEDDPVLVFMNQVSSYYTTLTGRLASSNDEVAITDISNLTVDFELIKQIMDQSKQNFKPKYSGDRIRSFNFFVPAIKTKIAAKKTREEAKDQSERKMVNGEHSQGNIDRRTIELVKNSKKEWSKAELPEVSF